MKISKTVKYLLFVLTMSIFSNCNKDEVSLNNKQIPINNTFDIDVDKDSINDIEFYAYYHTGMSHDNNELMITPLNGYEILKDSSKISYTGRGVGVSASIPNIRNFDSTLNVSIPKIYLRGDYINKTDSVINQSIFICYAWSANYDGHMEWKNREWIKDEERYIGFRKKTENGYKIGWIKLKVLDYSKAYLLGYKIPVETENLLIQ